MEEISLCDEHLWVGSSHLSEAIQVKIIGFLSSRNHPGPIFFSRIARVLIFLVKSRQPRPQRKLHSLNFAPSPVQVGTHGCHIALVPIEKRNRHPNVEEAFQADRFSSHFQ